MSLINFQIPNISDEEKTPVILQLVEIIEQISVVNLQQAEEIQLLKDEIARLKGLKPKPVIKPSILKQLWFFLAHFMLVERLRFENFPPLMCATHQHTAQHDLEN